MESGNFEKTIFGNPLLLGMILGFAIQKSRGGGREVSVRDVKRCRLVNGSWLEAVAAIYRKSSRPLFKFNLNESKPNEQGERFHSFVNDTCSLHKDVPTYSLIVTSLTSEYFNQYVSFDFCQCLSLYGEGLLELDVRIRNDADAWKFNLHQASLPRLKKFSLFYELTANSQSRTGSLLPPSNVNGLGNFLRIVLHGSSELQELLLVTPLIGGPPPDIPHSSVPDGFESIVLPRSLNFLGIRASMENKHLRSLARNPLPFLTHLILRVPAPSRFDEGVLFRLLKNVAESLEELEFDGVFHFSRPVLPTILSLPVLKVLKTLIIETPYLELNDARDSLERCLPSLTCLNLEDQPAFRFFKWTDASKFVKVEKLTLSIVDERFSFLGRGYLMDINREIINRARLAFPFLSRLELKIAGIDVSGIKHVFRSFKKLKTFKITVVEGTQDVINSDTWDAVFLGISIEEAGWLRESRLLWKYVQLPLADSPSIVDMTDLTELTLETVDYIPRRGSIISNAVFLFGFRKMPNLKEITVVNQFKATRRMVKRFKRHGQIIDYQIDREY